MYSVGMRPPVTLFSKTKGSGRLGVERDQLADDVGVLARAAGLLLVLVVERRLAGRRLAVADLGGADGALDLVLAADPLDVDLQVQLAHARDDRLAGLVVDVDAEGRVLAHEPVEGLGELVVVGPLGRLDRQVDDRLGGVDALEREVRALGAVGVAGGALEAHDGDDVAGAGRVDVFLLVGVDAEDAADPGLLPLPAC